MYTGIRLKSEILRWQLLLIVIFSFAFALVLNEFNKSLESRITFKVSVNDDDKTELSKRAVNEISGLSGVSIVEAGADVEYSIKAGYGEKFSEGKFEGLIEVRKNSFKQGISLLNDRIVTKLVSDYIYLNLFERINTVENISFENYEKNLEKTRLTNEILFIKVNDSKINDNLISEVDFASYIALFFLLSVCINIAMGRIIKLNRMRKKGLIDRMKLSGFGEVRVIFIELFIAFMISVVVALPFLLLRFETKIFIITALLLLVNFAVNIFIERLSKSEETLVFVIRSVMILFLVLGMFLNFYY